MHPRLERLESEIKERQAKKLQAIRWADETLQRLGLAELLDADLCDYISARPRAYSREGTNEVNLYVYPAVKPEVMRVLTDSEVEKWKRVKMLSTSDHDGGDWRTWLYIDFDYYEDDNRITVRFATPAEEGQEVDGCTIKRREISGTRLELACEI